ncbi:MAG: hypothetical protein ACN4GM_12555 [Gammaproteobacteria bacterium]
MNRNIILVVFFISILSGTVTKSVSADNNLTENNTSLAEIPYKKESDVSVETTVNVLVFLVSVLVLSAIGVYYLKKKGFSFPYNIVSSDDFAVLSINKISRKTTLYKIKLDGQEISILESSDNIVTLKNPEV